MNAMAAALARYAAVEPDAGEDVGVDENQIAGLVDGRLPADERQAILTRLSRSPSAMDWLAMVADEGASAPQAAGIASASLPARASGPTCSFARARTPPRAP